MRESFLFRVNFFSWGVSRRSAVFGSIVAFIVSNFDDIESGCVFWIDATFCDA